MSRHLLYLLALLTSNLFAYLALPVYGQEIPSLPSEREAPEGATSKDNHAIEGNALDLLITPRISADYNSPQAGDNGVGYSRLNAFVPLLQTPGQTLTFLNTSARLDTQNNLGGNIALGHRFLVNDLLWGGYVAYDIRNTNLGTFSQLGTGLEVFGENWDAHLNGYIPVGNSSQSTGGSTVTGSAFQGNQLLLTIGGGTLQQAQGGVDLDAGLRLAGLGDLGALWGYGGTYYYGNNFGGRLRLEQRAEAFQVGLGVDTGGLGTNVFVSVGLGWGGAPRNRITEEPTGVKQNVDEDRANTGTDGESVGDSNNGVNLGLWSRAANVVTRSNSVIIEQTTTATTTEVAVNPDTGQPYTFVFVTPDSANVNQGDGSLSNPYTTLGSSGGATTTGLGAASANNVVYVRPGDTATNPITGGVTIPSNVQLLSSGVAHSVSVSSSLGTTSVTLPDFGDLGTLPQIQNAGGEAVTLSTGATLSGFDISNAQTGIFANGVSNITIQNNQVSGITTSAAANRPAAIFLNDVTGTAVVSNNTISNTVGTVADGSAATLALWAAEAIGIGVTNTSATGASLNLTIANNMFTDSNGTVSTNRTGDAIAIGFANTTAATSANISATVNISGNTIQNIGTNDTGNTQVRGDGIKIALEEASSITSLIIDNNTIQSVVDDGIDISLGLAESATVPGIDASNARVTNAVVSNNQITGSTSGSGIILRLLGTNSAASITVQNNGLTGNTDGGLTASTALTNVAHTATLCLAFSGTTGTDNHTFTETLGLGTSTFTVVDRDNADSLNSGTITFTGGIGIYDTVASLANCTLP